MINNMSIKAIVAICIGVFILSMIGIGVIGVLHVVTIRNDYERISDGVFPRTVAISQVRDAMNRVQVAEKAIVMDVNDDERLTNLKAMSDEKSAVEALFEDYETEKVDEEQDLFRQVKAEWQNYLALNEQVLALTSQGRQEEAYLLSDEEADAAFLTVVETAGQWRDLNLQLGVDAGEDADRAADRVIILMMGIPLFFLLITVVIVLVFARGAIDPVFKLIEVTKKISTGNLNHVAEESRNELGQLGVAFNQMSAKIRERLAAEREQREHLERTVGEYVAYLAKVAQGDLSERLAMGENPRQNNDPLVQLGVSLNDMAASLENANEKMEAMLANEQSQREYIQSTVQEYASFMSEIARGNLTTRLAISSNGRGGEKHDDPLTILGRNLNDMVSSLCRMIGQIREAAGNLASATTEILAATTQQVSGASEQSAAISETTTTVDEVKTIAEQSSHRAQEVANTAQRTMDVSRSGQRAVEDTIDSMAQIKERVEGIAENILALSEQTQQIGEIIATVNDIASQSNMLALNASVEAARAGEHGKGFAVVAVEVRNLAEQSRQATTQVKAILSEIQKATNATVMVTEEGTKGVDRGVQLTAQAQEAIEQLSAVISESAQTAMQMTAAGQQQVTGVEQVAMAMRNINQATIQSLASTRQTEKAAQNLNDLARQLNDVVAQYQV